MERWLGSGPSSAEKLLAFIGETIMEVRQTPRTAPERVALADRIRRFRALSPQLQEGVLRYGEQLQNSYRS